MSDKTCQNLQKKTFAELGLSQRTLEALEKKGFEYPTPIQALTIPALLEGAKDIVGQAQTGTGKTAAFSLPLIELLEEGAQGVQALVLAPTRELALQVATEIDSLKGNKKLRVLPVYGGQSITVQLQKLRGQVDIVVGTPGRVIDHLDRRSLDLSTVTHVVLDEADEMLNMGFEQDVKAILEHTPKEKQVLLFSATMAPEILNIAKKYMRDYDILKVAQAQITCNAIDQIVYEVTPRQRFNALCRVIDSEEPFYGLVFCRTKRDTEQIAQKLTELGYHADALNGDMSQSAREKILSKFKKRIITILVATDVAARGIDVQNVTHVVNYALPEEPEAYVHRIGRTGRAGKAGKAISFAAPGDFKKINLIERKTNGFIKEAKLPSPTDIIETKKAAITQTLLESLEHTPKESYLSIARELLEAKEAEHIIAILLKNTYKGKLDPNRYVLQEEKPRKEKHRYSEPQQRDRGDRDRNRDRDRDRGERGTEDRQRFGKRKDRHNRRDRRDRNERGTSGGGDRRSKRKERSFKKKKRS